MEAAVVDVDRVGMVAVGNVVVQSLEQPFDDERAASRVVVLGDRSGGDLVAEGCREGGEQLEERCIGTRGMERGIDQRGIRKARPVCGGMSRGVAKSNRSRYAGRRRHAGVRRVRAPGAAPLREGGRQVAHLVPVL